MTKKQIIYDETYLQSRAPYAFVDKYCIFRFDDRNWCIAEHKDRVLKSNTFRYYDGIQATMKKLIDLLLAEGHEIRTLTDIKKELIEIHTTICGLREELKSMIQAR